MRPHQRLQGNDPLSQAGHERDWDPPGWHWEVLPTGIRILVRNQGPVVDPELLWWPSLGPRSFHRVEAPQEVIQRRVREEDEHVRRYMVALETRSSDKNLRVFKKITNFSIVHKWQLKSRKQCSCS